MARKYDRRSESLMVLRLALLQLERALHVAEDALWEIERETSDRFPNLANGPRINLTMQ